MGKILEASNRLLKAHRVACSACNGGRACSFAKGLADAQRKAVLAQVFEVATSK